MFLFVAKLPLTAMAQGDQTGRARHIIICVDGVGISTIRKMRAAGRFRMFHSPSHMISTFPTLTNAAMTEILSHAGADETGGYEDNYFDIEKNRMRGGVLNRLRGESFINGTFRELFDYHPSAIKSGLGYAVPPLTTYLESLSDLIRLRQKARKTKQEVFFAYTGATDSLAHLGGEKFVLSFLRQLDESVEDIARASKGPLIITIFSDHGNHFTKYRRVSLKLPLRQAGFNIEKRIKDDRSIVFPQFGLVGSAVLFTKAVNEPRLARVAASVEGVDFASYENQGIVYIFSRKGEATIEKRGQRYRYNMAKGDPLGLLTVTKTLIAKGLFDSDSFAADSNWFAATAAEARPDVVRRLFEGTTAGVKNRASVIVNFEDGYYTGSALFDVFTVLQATHGNIGQEQSVGFVMSTSRDLPAYVRAEDVWEVIGSPQLRKAKSDQ